MPEILLHFRWTDSELRALQLVQWPVVLFGKHLSGKGFPQTGIAFEQDQASAGFPRDYVAIFESQGMPQHFEQFACLLGDDEVTVNVILILIGFDVGDMGDDFDVPSQVVGVNQGMHWHFNLPALLIPLGDVSDPLLFGVLEVVPMVHDRQARQIGILGQAVCLRFPTAFRVADLDPAVDDKLFPGLCMVFLVGLLALAVFLQELLGFQTNVEMPRGSGKGFCRAGPGCKSPA